MQYVLGTFFCDNDAELFDDDAPGKELYSFAGLPIAIREGNKRIKQNSNIKQINIYKVFDGVRSISPQGRYQLVQVLLSENTTKETAR